MRDHTHRQGFVATEGRAGHTHRAYVGRATAMSKKTPVFLRLLEPRKQTPIILVCKHRETQIVEGQNRILRISRSLALSLSLYIYSESEQTCPHRAPPSIPRGSPGSPVWIPHRNGTAARGTGRTHTHTGFSALRGPQDDGSYTNSLRILGSIEQAPH